MPESRQRHSITALISEREIADKVAALAAEITRAYRNDGHHDITAIAVSTGAMIFAADLIRHIGLPMQVESVIVKSYRNTESSGNVRMLSELYFEIKDRHILLIDEILDTGLTMSHMVETMHSHSPASVRTCVLLDKPARRKVNIAPDFRGFEIQDLFVVGYGLDFNGYYRNLPYIGTLQTKAGPE